MAVNSQHIMEDVICSRQEIKKEVAKRFKCGNFVLQDNDVKFLRKTIFGRNMVPPMGKSEVLQMLL